MKYPWVILVAALALASSAESVAEAWTWETVAACPLELPRSEAKRAARWAAKVTALAAKPTIPTSIIPAISTPKTRNTSAPSTSVPPRHRARLLERLIAPS